MTANRFTTRRLLRRAAWGLCVGAALPGCQSLIGYDPHTAPPDPRLSPAPAASPTARGQVDSGGVTQVNWLRPGEIAAQPELQAVAQPPEAQPLKKPTEIPKPLDVPPGVPGAEAPRIDLPPDKPETRAARLKMIDSLFPEFAALGPDILVDGVPGAKPVTFEELLEIATKNSPDIAQAAADVTDAHGRWVQAGLYPNPTIGFQGDQIFDLGPFGQFGGFFNQPIVTGGKLKIARSVAFFDFLNARVQLRKAEVELARRVRTNFYNALVAAESVRVNRLVLAFTDEVYRRQVNLVKGGSAAPYEAAALFAINGTAEAALMQSRNQYIASWKQLAATVNSIDMPAGPLAGKADEALPRYHYEILRDQMLSIHTDIVVAKNAITQAERTITREQVKNVPDLQNQFYFEQDTLAKSQGAPNFQMGAQIGVTVPLFNRNQGGIMSARAQLARANAEVPRVQIYLVQQLADAFNRYETARRQAAIYRERILPNLVIAFRGVYQRYQVEPDKVNYNDIVTAQQNLVVQLGNYLQALQMQWQAQADLAGSVQVTNPAELLKLPDNGLPETWPDVIPRLPPPMKK